MDDDMEDYGFEYSDEEPEEADVDIENQYYNSKGMLEGDDLREALEGFEQVLTMEQGRGEWGFKALKQIVKLRQRLGQRDEMLAAYRRMLEYADGGGGAGGAGGGGGGGGGAVTRNAAEKKLNSLLDAVAAQAAAQQQQAAAAAARLEQASGQQQQASQQQQAQQAEEGAAAKAAAAAAAGGGDGTAAAAAALPAPAAEDPAAALLRAFYEQTVESLDRGRNERLWFKASMRLAHLALERADYPRAAALLRELHRACRLPGGGTGEGGGGGGASGGGAGGGGGIDPARGTQALEVYAAEIRMATEQRDNKRLKELYHQALSVKSAIPHPRVLGAIRECGGKMHMAERRWRSAHSDFFEAFKCYDEAGSARRVACLKYLVLATMLMGSDVDPFESQEAKPYKQDPEVVAMTDLVAAYQANDLARFERVLRTNASSLTKGDAFVRAHVDELRRRAREGVVLAAARPYERVRLGFLARKLGVGVGEVEELLVGLILDGRIQGRIDQSRQLLDLTVAADGAPAGASEDDEHAAATYAAMVRWADRLRAIHGSMCARM